jgi:D-ribose pyranase
MKKTNLLNPEIIKSVAKLGHTDYFVICDAGLSIPNGVNVVDVSVSKGIPAFIDVLHAVAEELVVDSFIYAE